MEYGLSELNNVTAEPQCWFLEIKFTQIGGSSEEWKDHLSSLRVLTPIYILGAPGMLHLTILSRRCDEMHLVTGMEIYYLCLCFSSGCRHGGHYSFYVQKQEEKSGFFYAFPGKLICCFWESSLVRILVFILTSSYISILTLYRSWKVFTNISPGAIEIRSTCHFHIKWICMRCGSMSTIDGSSVTNAYYGYVGYILAQVKWFIFCKHRHVPILIIT